ncbi:MAG TPA: WxcM-like domain-containing protein [Blastocatellia bacterium]|jgi:dTDP-4-dehydrorhamnose 3,5-epimerase
MSLIVQRHEKIVTKNKSGRPNGWLLPIFNVNDGVIPAELHPQQAYITVVAPGETKGPHLHLKRWGLFTCIRGNVKVIVRTESGYDEYESGEDHGFATIQIPPGTPAMLLNRGWDEAYLLNLPSPAWQPDDQDEHPVSFDDYELKKHAR